MAGKHADHQIVYLNFNEVYQLVVFVLYLHSVSHLYESTGRMEGPGSTGIQMRTVIVVHNLHIVDTVRLKQTYRLFSF